MSFSPFNARTGHFIFFRLAVGSYLIKWRYHGEVMEFIWADSCCTVFRFFNCSADMVLVTSAYTSFLISSDDLAVCCNKEYLWRTDGFIVCHTGSGIPCDLEINSTCLSIKLSPRTAAPANDMINEMLESLAAISNAIVPPQLCPIMPIFRVLISFLLRR